jgi:hypothetical protein
MMVLMILLHDFDGMDLNLGMLHDFDGMDIDLLLATSPKITFSSYLG